MLAARIVGDFVIITLQDTETREISAKIDELHEERGEAALGLSLIHISF